MGGLIIPHGYSKLINFSSRSASFSDPFHIGNSTSMMLAIFAEFFCGIFIVLGLMTRLAVIPLLITMAVIIFHIHKGQVFGDGETASLFMAGYLALLFMGPGKISVDRLIGK